MKYASGRGESDDCGASPSVQLSSYRRAFDVRPDSKQNAYYTPKLDYDSPHARALAQVRPGQGCSTSVVRAVISARLESSGLLCDRRRQVSACFLGDLDEFIQHDLDEGTFPRELDDLDVVLILDVIEHLRAPEEFIRGLCEVARRARQVKIVISTGNVAFAVERLMLLMGQFNYGKRGILDITHTRLFTFGSLRRLLEESGFRILSAAGVPAPVPLAVRQRWLAKLLLRVNEQLIRASRAMFAYQIVMVVEPVSSLERLLLISESHTTDVQRFMVRKLATLVRPRGWEISVLRVPPWGS